jgi:hypothetical protein
MCFFLYESDPSDDGAHPNQHASWPQSLARCNAIGGVGLFAEASTGQVSFKILGTRRDCRASCVLVCFVAGAWFCSGFAALCHLQTIQGMQQGQHARRNGPTFAALRGGV